MKKEQFIEELLPGWFDGSLSDEEKQKVLDWKQASDENANTFVEFEKVWQKTEQLRSMEKYNAQQALEEVNVKMISDKRHSFMETFKRIAAVLLLPLLLASIYLYLYNPTETTTEPQWYTLSTGAGMRSQFELPDGTHVYLNSNTTLRFPIAFSENRRDVELNGEAYFDVAENKEKPFLVNTGKIMIEVTGTEFKASNYAEEKLTEIVLVEGSVNLCQCNAEGERSVIQALKPGEMATLAEADNKLFVEEVDVEKYIAWKDGILMLEDDSMEEVVRRLSRWFNVDIKLTGKELDEGSYKMTFEDESLMQVLELLEMSERFNYKLKPRKRNSDGTFSKMEIEIILN